MNAKEIREETARVSETLVKEPAARSLFGVLGEIAAQLAELNWNISTLTDHPVRVQCEPGQWPIVVENKK